MKIIQSLLFTITLTFLVACNENKNREKELQKIKSDSTNYTTIKWINKTIDLGTINSGEVRELAFKFVNTGSKPLYLGNVNAGCGCTVPSYSTEPVAPGAEGFVIAKFDSKNQCDAVTKSIYVPSNAINDSIATLNFTANVINCKSNDIIVPKRATINDSLEIK